MTWPSVAVNDWLPVALLGAKLTPWIMTERPTIDVGTTVKIVAGGLGFARMPIQNVSRSDRPDERPEDLAGRAAPFREYYGESADRKWGASGLQVV